MTMFSRRHVLQALGAGALLAPFGLQACLEPLSGKTGKVSPVDSAAKPDLVEDVASTPDLVAQDAWGGDAPDTWEQFQEVQADVNKEIETQLDAGGGAWPVVILESFQVYLGDTDCSKHPHACYVEAGTYTDNALVQVNGGHPMALRPLEMKSLDQGGQLPYHTLPHQSHHHCGTAIRMDLFKSDFDNDVTKLEDFFQCVVPKLMPEDTPEQWMTSEYGPCTYQKVPKS